MLFLKIYQIYSIRKQIKTKTLFIFKFLIYNSYNNNSLLFIIIFLNNIINNIVYKIT